MGGSKTYVTHKDADASRERQTDEKLLFSAACSCLRRPDGMAETHPFFFLPPFGGGRGSRREGTVAFVTNYGKRRRGVGRGVAGGGADAPAGGDSDGFRAKEGKREREE